MSKENLDRWALDELYGALLFTRGNALDRLEAVFKDRSKTLHRALQKRRASVGLMQVQEAVASVCGFTNTHALQSTLSNLRDLVKSEVERDHHLGNKWLDQHEGVVRQFGDLFKLGEDLADELPLKPGREPLLARMADSVASKLSISAEAVSESVAEAWCGMPSWKSLQERSPLNTPLSEPLVTFGVLGDPASKSSEGIFSFSQAAHWIWDNELVVEERGDKLTGPAEIRLAYIKALEIARKHPEFLVPWINAAGIAEDHSDVLEVDISQVHQLYDEGIKATEALIPAGFKGTLSWYSADNRPYISALGMKRLLLIQTTGGLPKALAYANKLLRLSPDDNLGARMSHPLLVAMVKGDTPALRKSIARAMKSLSPSSMLHVGMAKLWIGDLDGAALFIEAVMRVPHFGQILLKDEKFRPITPKGDQPIGYVDPWQECLTVQRALVEDLNIGRWVKSVLKDRSMLMEERRLETLMGTRKTGLNWDVWDEEVPKAAKEFSEILLQRYPLPDRSHVTNDG